MNIRKVTITVTMFYNADYYTPEDISSMDLEQVHTAITEGDCVGLCHFATDEEVPADQVSQALIDIGNDGTYFNED